TETSYLDTGFGDNNRHYTVVAVDIGGAKSLERSLTLPKLEIEPEFEGRIQRGVFNPVTCLVHNVSEAAVEHARLQVTFNGHKHYSEFFDLAAGEEKRVSLIIGGFDDLMDLAEYNAVVEILPNPEERVRIVRTGTVEVGVGILAMELITKQMIRGATGKVRFTLENPGDVDVEIITARNNGSELSDEIGFTLLDEDENVLMSAGYRQILGQQVVTLANGTTVARIPAKGRFESQWIDLPVPEAAPDTVFVKAVINQLHYRTGQDDEIIINGVAVVREATTIDTEYLCELIDVRPATSFGDDEIIMIGRARDRQTDMTVPFVPLRLVISGNGFERSIDLETQADGGFTYRYAPLPADSGVYRVSCIHPDLLERPGQGAFTIAAVQISPQNIRINMPRQYELNLKLTVTTGRGTTAQDLALQFLPVDQETGNLPEGITVTLSAPINLGSVQSAVLAPTIFADTDAPESGEIVLRLVSNESGGNPLAMARIAFHLSEAKPALSVNPSYIDTGVVHGQTINEKIIIKNNGLADLTDTTVNLLTDDGRAVPEWISIVSNRNVGRLPIGQASEIVLEARPDETVVEKSYQFLLQVRGAEIAACNVPISVLVTQSGEGNVLFHLSDLYTATLDKNNELISGLAGARLELQYESVSG
ncbi:MAG: hypothetical protein KAR13_21915, partial [Desulfobulbaceae bacterium]|nr:hypothetical protein [Desulfobulbaceae bacterium]